MTAIRIQNLYYLLLYAHDVLDEAEVVDVGELPETSLADLFAHVLDAGIAHLFRRGLDRGYLPYCDEIAGVRGRIDLSATAKVGAQTRARLVCDFDEFTADVPHNRILRATVRRLLRVPGLAPELHENLSATYLRLAGVGEEVLSSRSFRRVQLHRNNRFYGFLLSVCRLIHEAMMPAEGEGEERFRDFVRDERRMRALFERFIRNFYRREQTSFRVRPRRFFWAHASGNTESLPQMATDVCLESPARTLVLDAKYYREAFQQHHKKRTLRSAHLYQLYAYLRNLAAQRPSYRVAEGVLIYPATGERFDINVQLGDHPIRAVSLDLAQDWRGLRRDLLAIAGLS